jgi:guanylate cyclase
MFKFIKSIFQIGISPEDTEEVRLHKFLLVTISFGTSLPGFIWGIIYSIMGEPIVSLLPFGYAFLGAIIFFYYKSNPIYYKELFVIVRVMILMVPFLIFLLLGGYFLSSSVIIWSLMAPFTSLLIERQRNARKWFFLLIILIAIGSFTPPLRTENNFSETVIQFFFFGNIIGMSITTFIMIYYTVNERNRFYDLLGKEKKKSEELLLNVLPVEVIPFLHESTDPYVEDFESVSVLFADIAGFTKLSENMGGKKMVDLLNKIFSNFDSLLTEHKAEKIRTIGDNYMVTVGAPVREDDHAYLLVSMAKKMVSYLNSEKIRSTGVIGKHKFHFDIWGDTVNTASRLESYGIPGKIQIGEETANLIKGRIPYTFRGEIEMKGKGLVPTWIIDS